MNDAGRHANAALPKSLTAFLILIYLGEEAAILSFLDAGWTDLCLPMISKTPSEFLPPELSLHLRANFETIQWSFLSPEFNRLGEHLDLDERAILPYLDMSETIIRRGIIGDVSILCTRIHPLYQTIYHPNGVRSPH